MSLDPTLVTTECLLHRDRLRVDGRWVELTNAGPDNCESPRTRVIVTNCLDELVRVESLRVLGADGRSGTIWQYDSDFATIQPGATWRSDVGLAQGRNRVSVELVSASGARLQTEARAEAAPPRIVIEP